MKLFFPILAFAAVLAPAASPAAPSPVQPIAVEAAPRTQLQEVATTTSFGTRFVRLRQEVGGVPVLGGDAVVTDAPGAKRDLLIDHTYSGIHAPGAPSLSREQAERAATRAVGVIAFRAEPSAALTILPRMPGGVLVWRVVLPTASPLGSFEVLVDARSGAILRTRDLLRHATGQAAIFDPNPVEANGGPIGLADNDDADSPLLTSLRTPVTLQRLNGGNCLDGQWVKAVLPAGPVCLAGRDFRSVTRQNDNFEALMAYFHIDRTQSYIESLGFTNVVNRQLLVTADANIGDPGDGSDDNSFYDPSTGEISLGPGGVDDGEDADVINHEYGHAMQDSQVPGFGEGGEAGAIGEGFGDYFAADMSALYTPSPLSDPCIGEWDALAMSLGCIRRVDSTQTLAELRSSSSCAADVHCVGQAWSSALWTLRGALGAPAADKLIIQSQFSLLPNATFEDASRALLAADRQLYGGANQALLRSDLANRGLLDLAHLDDQPDGATPLGVPGQASGELDAGSDVHDVYSVALSPGHGVMVNLAGAGDFDLRLYGPGTTSVFTGTVLAGSTTQGTATESFSYAPSSAGTYFLDISAVSGAGGYTVQAISDLDGDGLADGNDNCPSAANRDQKDTDRDRVGDACDKFPRDAANDVDRDGLGANADNCPKVANKNQRDWNHNNRGDACDRSSRITISAVSVRGHRVTLVGSLRPLAVAKAGWNVFAQRSGACATCRFARAARQQGARKLSSGRIRFTFVLARAGRYRIHATLADPRFKHSRSRFATIQIGRG